MSTKYLFAAMTARTDDPVAKLILIYLADAANEKGYCWPSHSTIAAGCECSVATVKRKIEDLIVMGYIDYQSRSQKGFKTSNKYEMIDPEHIKTNGKPKIAQSEPSSPTIAQPELTDSSHRAIEPINTLSNTLSKGFKRPTLDDVKSYCAENGYGFDAEVFINYYQSNGWKVGRASMKCWKSACTNWQKRERPKQSSRGSASTKATTLEQDLNDTSWAH